MIENNCYCDKCEQRIENDGVYFKMDIRKAVWASNPDEADKSKEILYKKVHLCPACNAKIMEQLK